MFGKDFFKVLSFIVQALRLFAAVFGDDADKKAATESKERTSSGDSEEVC